MLLSEQAAFDDEIKLLMIKYRIKFFIGYYFPYDVVADQKCIIIGCSAGTGKEVIPIVSGFTMDLLRIAEPYEAAIKEL